MKKIVMIAFVAAATLSFTACNSKTDDTALDKYAEIVEKAIALQAKVAVGDAEAKIEFAALNNEVANISTQLQAEMANMTPEQSAKFTELADKLAASATAK